MTVVIRIDGESQQRPAGLVSGAQLYDLAGSSPQRLFLNREDGIDIPISPEDHLLIKGNESFVVGDSQIEDNPPLRKELKPEFNGAHEIALAHAKIEAQALKAHDPQFPDGRLFADIPDAVDVEIFDHVRLVVQETDSYFVIPPGDAGGPIDVEECGKHDRRPPKGGAYRYRLDREKYTSETEKISGEEILGRAGETPPVAGKNLAEWSLNQKLRGGKRIKVDGDSVDLSAPGVERFESVRRQAQQGR
ncbi:MAG: hypothetical protein OXI33_13675 [Chloroflexota bacterium]|nr:hypothetical protein [Chloroflexota bacterium]